MDKDTPIHKVVGKLIEEAIPYGKMREKILQANMYGKFGERQIIEALAMLLEREDERERGRRI